MAIEIHMDGDNTDKILDNLEDAMKTALDAAGLQAASLAKTELENNPSRIDTGLLRNSITHAVSGESVSMRYKGSETHGNPKSKNYGKPAPPPHEGSYSGSMPKEDGPALSAYIGTNVEYAFYVHEGSEYMSANRFLKNALRHNQGELADIIQNTLRNLMP